MLYNIQRKKAKTTKYDSNISNQGIVFMIFFYNIITALCFWYFFVTNGFKEWFW